MKENSKLDLQTILKITNRSNKTIRDYGLIDDNDQILIGLSGGKDSLALVEILGEKMKLYKPKLTLIAAHISIDNITYQSDVEYLREHCEAYNIPFIHHTTSIKDIDSKLESPCFLCSWNRRKALFEIAKENNCNKIAMGHHQDDVLETLLMNMTYQGTISTMPPLMKMDKFDMQIIRPLALNTELEMLEWQRIKKYKLQDKNCPYEKVSRRTDMKNILHQLEKLNPNVRGTMWSAMENIKHDYLPRKIAKKQK